jgi:hypothetical protein
MMNDSHRKASDTKRKKGLKGQYVSWVKKLGMDALERSLDRSMATPAWPWKPAKDHPYRTYAQKFW